MAFALKDSGRCLISYCPTGSNAQVAALRATQLKRTITGETMSRKTACVLVGLLPLLLLLTMFMPHKASGLVAGQPAEKKSKSDKMGDAAGLGLFGPEGLT